MTVQTFLLEDGVLVPLADAAGEGLLESYRIEGAIALEVEGTALLSRHVVDFVVQLWEYLLNGLEGLGRGESLETGYPDLPFEIRVVEVDPRRSIRHLQITTGTRSASATAVVAWDEFFRVMTDAGQTFFESMLTIHPRGASEYARERERAERLAELAGQSDSRFHP